MLASFVVGILLQEPVTNIQIGSTGLALAQHLHAFKLSQGLLLRFLISDGGINVGTHCLVGQVLVGILLAFLLGNFANHNLVIRVILANATEGVVILGANNGGRLGELLGQDDGHSVKVRAIAQGSKVLIHIICLSGL